MLAVLHSLGMLIIDVFKSRRRLEVENLFLRHQLEACAASSSIAWCVVSRMALVSHMPHLSPPHGLVPTAGTGVLGLTNDLPLPFGTVHVANPFQVRRVD
jgi:hypothetical protein